MTIQFVFSKDIGAHVISKNGQQPEICPRCFNFFCHSLCYFKRLCECIYSEEDLLAVVVVVFHLYVLKVDDRSLFTYGLVHDEVSLQV